MPGDAEVTPDPLIGQQLGQYELQEVLGQGGMAAVYRALQPSLGRQVAVKVLPLTPLHDSTLPQRFRREARLAANLMHPNIVPVYDFGEWGEYLFIVMALVAGGTLKERLDGPMPLESAVRLVGQVADALGYAHGQGVYHRDVKPTNVLLGPGDWAMLSDFGIARALGETTRLTNPQGTIGTPAYMAPEQWLGEEINGRADLYSLGIVLYELLAGSPPFRATTAQGLMRQHLEMPIPSLASSRPDLPFGIESVLQRVLAKAPADRFLHAGEFKAAMERAALTPTAPPPPSGPFATSSGASTTVPRVARPSRETAPFDSGSFEPPSRRSSSMPIFAVGTILFLVVLLAAAVGYIVATSVRGAGEPIAPAATAQSVANVPIPATATPQVPPTATQPIPTVTPVIVVVTATAQPAASTTSPPSTAPQTVVAEAPTVAPSTAPLGPPATPTTLAKPSIVQPTVTARFPLTPPPPTGSGLTDLDANRARVLREGFTPDHVAQSPDGHGSFLVAIRGVCTRSDGGNCQKVFFFIGSRYLGTDTFKESRSITNVSSGGAQRIRVTYGNYRLGDPQCCPSLSSVTITYTWDGSRLTPDGTPPGH